MPYTDPMARDMMTIRIDPVTKRRLGAAARRRGGTASDVARRALVTWLDREEGQATEQPFRAISDLIGCVEGGDPGRSTRDVASIVRTAKARRGFRKK